MGICLHRLGSPRLPVKDVSEQVMAFPVEGGILLKNTAFKIVCFLEGAARLTLDDEETYTLSAGDIMVLPRACRQFYRAGEPRGERRAHVLILQFTPNRKGAGRDRAFARYLQETFSRPQQLRTGVRFDLRDLVARLRRDVEGPSGWHEEGAHEVVKQFVFLTAELLGIYRVPPRPEIWERAEAAFAKGEAFTAARLPPAPLFRRRMGMSLARFKAAIRVERAKEAMIYSSQPLSLIARNGGFSSLSAFSRTFRTITGSSPREFQRQLFDPPKKAVSPVPVPSSPVGDPVWLDAPAEVQGPGVLFSMGGTGEVVQGRKRWPVSTDTVLLLPGPAAGRVPAVGRLVWVPLNRVGRLGTGGPLILPRERELQEARRYLALLEARGAEGRHGQMAMASLLRSSVLEWLCQRASPERDGRKHEPEAGRRPVDYAREYLHKNYIRSLRLADVAWFAGVSEEHLARTFQATTGLTVMQYLRRLRIRRAALLLREQPEGALSDVAEQCGFSSAALLCRVFRQETGMTPGEFRKNGGFAKDNQSGIMTRPVAGGRLASRYEQAHPNF